MGDELRHLNSSCGCGMPGDDSSAGCDGNSCGKTGGSWLWLIILFIFLYSCNGSGGICGITNCNIDCGDFLTIIIILLVLNCFCSGGEGNMLGGLLR